MMKNHIGNTHTEAHHAMKMVGVMVIFIFFTLVLIGTVSAIQLNPFGNNLQIDREILDDTNDFLKPDFNEKYGSIRISKTLFWIKTDRLAEYSLIENTDLCYYNCYAEGKAVLYNSGVLFEDVNFKKRNGDNFNNVDSKFYIYGKKNVTKKIAQFKNHTFTSNSSTYERFIGYENKLVEVDDWIEYNNEILDAGNYLWRLEGKKKPTETMDWIVTAFGKKFNDWEWWEGEDVVIENFTANGTFVTPDGVDFATVIVIAGGGGGGTSRGGGGGGGGFLRNNSFAVSGNITVVIGVGGGTPGTIGIAGQNSSFGSMVAIGGGQGGQGGGTPCDGANGGSGGGGGGCTGANVAGVSLDGQGNDGAAGSVSGVAAERNGGGGGGANTTGGAAGTSVDSGGLRGTGNFIVGLIVARGGAGGNGTNDNSQSAVNGTGDGGDGAGGNPGSGGSGRVIVIYNVTSAPTVTLNSPEDNFNTTNATIEFNGTVDGGGDGVANITLYIDDIFNQTNSTPATNNITIFTETLSDGTHNWTYEGCGPTNLCANATRTLTVNTTPNIVYIYPTPINGFNSSEANLTVNISLTEDFFLNLTIDLYNVNGDLNLTVTYTNSSRQINWTNLQDATYSYNATVFTTTSQSNFTETRNISIDSNNPDVEILAPPTTVTFHEINTNLSVNWSINDTNLDTCILEYEGVNRTLTCIDNTTEINITTISNRTITIYANDTFGNVNSTSRSWDYTLFQSSLTFSAETIGGSTEEFILNVTKDSSLSISTVDLVYNLSASAAPFTLGDNSTITASLDVPNPAADDNFSFFFSFLMSDAQIINTSSTNQSVLNFGIGNCSTFSTLIFNFTMLDEENQTELVNVTIDYAFNLFDDSRETLITNFSESSTVNPTEVCINQNLTTSSFSLDAILQYVSTDGSYLPRFHNILNFTLTNSSIPNNVTLFDVLDTTATPFQLTFRDSLLVLAPNILVNVNKQFVASNDFKTVEIPITDTNGQAILNLVRNTAIYNLIFINIKGEIVATFNQINAFCQDSTIGDCTLELDSASTTPETFNQSETTSISFTIEYTNATSLATLNFNSINSTAVTVRLIGTTQNQFGNRSVCDNSLTSTLGTITCNASSILTTDNLLFIDVLSDGVYVSTTIINISPTIPLVGGFFGQDGFFLAFFMLLIIIMLFSNDKQVLVVMLGLGWAVILILGLVKGTVIGSFSGGIWLIVTIGIFLWKLKQEEVGT